MLLSFVALSETNMGIRFLCPNGHYINVKSFLAGKRGICPECGVGLDIPSESQVESRSKSRRQEKVAAQNGAAQNGATNGAVANHAENGHAETPMLATAVAEETPAKTIPTVAPANSASANSASANSASANSASSPTPSLPASASSALTEAKPTPAANSPEPVMFQEVEPVKKVDPIAEAPAAVWYVRPPSGGQYGPANGEVMRGWLDDGRVGADALVWREGWEEWAGADTIFPELMPQPSPSETPKVSSGPAVLPASSPAPSVTPARPAPYRRPQSSSPHLIILLVLGVVSILLLSVLLFLYVNRDKGEEKSEAQAKPVVVANVQPVNNSARV